MQNTLGDDAPREKMNDHSKVNPTLPRPDIGDVARLLPGNGLPANHEMAFLVKPARCEVLARARLGAMLNAWSLSVVRLNFLRRMT